MSKLRGISGGLNSDSPRRHHSFVLIERNYTRTLFRVPNVPRVWFLLDELATLQRLPQLHTVVTETRWRKGLKDCQIYPREAFRRGGFIETARCLRRERLPPFFHRGGHIRQRGSLRSSLIAALPRDPQFSYTLTKTHN